MFTLCTNQKMWIMLSGLLIIYFEINTFSFIFLQEMENAKDNHLKALTNYNGNIVDENYAVTTYFSFLFSYLTHNCFFFSPTCLFFSCNALHVKYT